MVEAIRGEEEGVAAITNRVLTMEEMEKTKGRLLYVPKMNCAFFFFSGGILLFLYLFREKATTIFSLFILNLLIRKVFS